MKTKPTIGPLTRSLRAWAARNRYSSGKIVSRMAAAESTVESRSWPEASSRARNCSVVRPVNGTDALWRTIEEAISNGAAAIAE